MILSIFIDLRNAFDTVSHSLILKKLNLLGVSDIEQDWYQSYLRGRRQSVQMNNRCSEHWDVSVGIPQGSLLRVLLFQVLINDLPKCLKFCSAVLYAYDMTIYVIGKNLKFLKQKIQSDMNALTVWLRINHLKLNIKKTKAMLLNREGLCPDICLLADGEKIEQVSSLKFLGIVLDV